MEDKELIEDPMNMMNIKMILNKAKSISMMYEELSGDMPEDLKSQVVLLEFYPDIFDFGGGFDY